MHRPQPPLGLVEQRRDADGMRPALVQHVHQVVEGDAAIDNVLDNQHLRPFERNVQVLGDLHFTRTGFPFPVTGNAHEVDVHVALHGPRQVRQEEGGAFQNGDHVEAPAGIIAGNLFAEFLDPGLDLLGGD